MYTDNNGAGSRVFVGLLVGMAIGAAIGLAFAPYAGVETRRRLSESGQKLRDRAVGGYERASANVNHILYSGREAIAQGRQAYERARSEVAETLEAS